MNKPVLLMVANEEYTLHVLRKMLFTSYKVLMTTDPREAIRILSEEKVQVIISDQHMQLMQGSELLNIAHKVSPSTTRILMVNYSDLDDMIAMESKKEVCHYLTKPLEDVDVEQVVAKAVASCKRKPRIMIMDDDEMTARLVYEILQDRCELIWVKDEQDALKALSNMDISIIVSDLVLGDTNVDYILKSIKERCPQTQCIVVTSFNDTSHITDVINKIHITHYLPKPISKNNLTHNLESLLAHG